MQWKSGEIIGTNIMLFGEGGFGKTTIMKQIFNTLLTNESKLTVVPIFIDVKKVDFSFGTNSIAEYIWKHFCGTDSNRESLMSLLHNKTTYNSCTNYKIVLIVDGINETAHKNKFFIADELKSILDDNSAVSFVMSSRIDETQQSEKFKAIVEKKYKLLPLTKACIVDVLSKNIFQTDKSFLTDTMSSAWYEILQNPMFLSIFIKNYCNVTPNDFIRLWKNNRIRKADILNEYIEKMLTDATNSFDTSIATEKNAVLKYYIEAIAYEMVKKDAFMINRTSARELWNEDSEIFPTAMDTDELDFQFKALLYSKNNDILRFSNGNYYFGHQIFRDYFAACFFVSLINEKRFNEIDRILPSKISIFIGEILKTSNGYSERDFLFDTELNKSHPSPIESILNDNKSILNQHQKVTNVLIDIMKNCRDNNLSYTTFDGLDLKNANLRDCDLRSSSFDNTKVYLNNFIPTGHSDEVYAATVADDVLITASFDSTIRLWDIKTHELISILTPDKPSAYSCVEVSPDKKILIAGCYNGMLQIWDYQTKSIIKILEFGESDEILSLSFSKDGGYFAYVCNETAHIIETDSLKEIENFCDFDVCKFSPTNTYIALLNDKHLVLLDYENRDVIYDAVSDGVGFGYIHDITYSKNGRYLAWAGRDVTILDVHTNERTIYTDFSVYSPLSIAFSLGEKYLAVGKGTVKIFDLETSNEVSTTEFISDILIDNLFFYGENEIIAVGLNETCFYNISDKKTIGSSLGKYSEITTIAKYDNKTFVSSGTDSCIRTWDISENILLHFKQTDCCKGMRKITVSPDKKNLVVYSELDNKLFVYDATTDKAEKKIELPNQFFWISSICFLDNNKIIVAFSSAKGENFVILNIDTAKMQIITIESITSERIETMCMSENAHYIVAAGNANIYIIDTLNEFHYKTIPNNAYKEQMLIKGNILFVVSVERNLCYVMVYEVSKNAIENEYKYSLDANISCASLSDDCTTLVICDVKGCISLINIMDSSIIGKIYTYDTEIRNILFIEQENVVVTDSDKNGLNIWNLNKKTVVSLPETTSFLKGCDFSKSVFQKNESDEIKHLLKTNSAFIDNENVSSAGFEFITRDFEKYEEKSFVHDETPTNSIFGKIKTRLKKEALQTNKQKTFANYIKENVDLSALFGLEDQ